MSQITKPRNVRRIHTRSCANFRFNIFNAESEYRICQRSGESEWGEPEEMSNYVCDDFKKYNGIDACIKGGAA